VASGATTSTLTNKGHATRARIIEAAADLVLARGVGGTSLDDIRAGTATSKSQLFHYFPGGKAELVRAIVALQGERVLDAQRPHLDELDTWASWDAWRDAVIAHYAAQSCRGCPIGALAAELAAHDPAQAADVTASMDRWRGLLEAGVTRMRDRGLLRPDTDPARLALSMFAALHGGLMLMQAQRSITPLEAALDGALVQLRAAATPRRAPRPSRR
jgi:AcrR family transcriptional regulator